MFPGERTAPRDDSPAFDPENRVWPEARWGYKHPKDPRKFPALKRASWSDRELKVLSKWITARLAVDSDKTNNLASKCMKYVRETQKHHEHFHPLHMTGSCKFRHGIKAAIQRNFFNDATAQILKDFA